MTKLTFCTVIFIGLFSLATHAEKSLEAYPYSSQSATDVHVISPFTSQGLNLKLKVVKELDGLCWSSSLADSSRPNTWRCHSKETVFDPCFQNPTREQNTVACLQNPWDKNVVLLKLSAPLPNTKNQPLNRNKSQPWAIKLGNGKLCTLSTIPNFSVAGMEASYQCSNGAVVIGQIDRSAKRWLVFYLDNDDLFMHQTEVVSAWY